MAKNTHGDPNDTKQNKQLGFSFLSDAGNRCGKISLPIVIYFKRHLKT
jgi:hypothetical protein